MNKSIYLFTLLKILRKQRPYDGVYKAHNVLQPSYWKELNIHKYRYRPKGSNKESFQWIKSQGKYITWLLVKAPPPVLTRVSIFKDPIGTKLRISAMKIKIEKPTKIIPRMKNTTFETWTYQTHSIYFLYKTFRQK